MKTILFAPFSLPAVAQVILTLSGPATAKQGATVTDDQTGDGKCDILDVLIVVLRALGL